jgi:hypothetical protein
MFKGIDFDSTIFCLDFWTFLTVWYIFFPFYFNNISFIFWWSVLYMYVTGLSKENHALACCKSVNCQRKLCTNLSQVTELSVKSLNWQWKQSTDLSQVTEIVGENHAPTCRKSENCPRKPSIDPSQVTELCVKTMHWPVASHWIVRENHALTCHKSLNC